MKLENIDAVKVELQRLQKAIEEYEANGCDNWNHKFTANIKRKSMDLTRALSKMRQERY